MTFREAMAEAGLHCPHEPVADGQFHRFKNEGDAKPNSWYVLHADSPQAGAFGCFKREIGGKWCDKSGSGPVSDEVRRRWAEVDRARKREQARVRDEARAKAMSLLESSKDIENNDYLSRKRVRPYGELRNLNGSLLVPLRNSSGGLESLQFIHPDGSKKFLTGGSVSGAAFVIQGDDSRVLLCEGVATGLSLYEATGATVVCAMNCGNLHAVAESFRGEYPDAVWTVCGDDDRKTVGNPGRTRAEEAAELLGCRAVFPEFVNPEGKSDFNDLHVEQGLDAVRRQVEQVEASEPSSVTARFDTDKPGVILPSGDVTITDTSRQLFKIAGEQQRLFLMGGTVVEKAETSTGLALSPVKPSAFRSMFDDSVNFTAWRVGRGGVPVLKPSIMAEETARGIIDCHSARELLPRVSGLVNCPLIVEGANGLEVCGKGLHQPTGLLVLRGETPPEVPLGEAVETLKSLVAETRFQTEGDRSRALAAFIAPALKMGGLLRGFVPVDVREADDSQAGKSYAQKVVAALYGEDLSVVPSKRGGTGSLDESFMGRLVAGRPFVQFDNLRGRLDSPALEAFVTTDGVFPCRIPRQPEIEVDPSKFFVMATSNGVESTRDLANRSSIIRLLKRPEHPYRDVLREVKARQSYFLGCVFAVAREWHQQGEPKTSESRHDFREWCQTLDWIVQNILGEAPLMDGHDAAKVRVSNPVITFMRSIGLEIERQDRLGESLIAGQILEIAEGASIDVPGVDSAGDLTAQKRALGSKLATVFKSGETLEIDHLSLQRHNLMGKREDGKGSCTVKTYTFSRKPHKVHKGSSVLENCTVFPETCTPYGGSGDSAGKPAPMPVLEVKESEVETI